MSEERTVSRREFLKIAGVAGATIGVAGGLGGLVAACGGDEETTTTAGAATTAAPTTTAGAATRPLRVRPRPSRPAAEAGREIKVGMRGPQDRPSGGLRGPVRLGQRTVDHEVWPTASSCGDGKNHPIKTYVEDTQSDTNRCAQVTGDLIQNTKRT